MADFWNPTGPATKKLLDRIGPPTLQDGEQSTTVLGQWYATALPWRPQVALLPGGGAGLIWHGHWIEEDVPQCGYCQSGQLMSAAVLLREKPRPTDEDIDQAMAGNICRCGTYPRIRQAIHRAAGTVAKGGAR